MSKKKTMGKFALFLFYSVLALTDLGSNLIGIIPGIGDLTKFAIEAVIETISGIIVAYILFVMK